MESSLNWVLASPASSHTELIALTANVSKSTRVASAGRLNFTSTTVLCENATHCVTRVYCLLAHLIR